MKKILQFLRQLKANNNREWFNAHKNEYREAQDRFNQLVEELIMRIGEYDPTVQNLTIKECTYRIYRDVRFSKDKSPYKTHMGAYICRGGKKSGFSGYYFHIGTGDSSSYPDGHMLAAGDYQCEPKVLRILREDIMNGDGDFQQIIQGFLPHFTLDESFTLKRVPQGFPADQPYSPLLKYKVYCAWATIDTDFLLAPNLAQRVADRFRPTKPLLDYINRAIEYVREEGI